MRSEQQLFEEEFSYILAASKAEKAFYNQASKIYARREKQSILNENLYRKSVHPEAADRQLRVTIDNVVDNYIKRADTINVEYAGDVFEVWDDYQKRQDKTRDEIERLSETPNKTLEQSNAYTECLRQYLDRADRMYASACQRCIVHANAAGQSDKAKRFVKEETVFQERALKRYAMDVERMDGRSVDEVIHARTLSALGAGREHEISDDILKPEAAIDFNDPPPTSIHIVNRELKGLGTVLDSFDLEAYRKKNVKDTGRGETETETGQGEQGNAYIRNFMHEKVYKMSKDKAHEIALKKKGRYRDQESSQEMGMGV